jgi:hypothetical protein
MLKHIGKHNERKVVVLFHTVPGEDHMCLVAYSDLLPRIIHDTIMTSLETPVGQQATNFADACHRTIMADGRNVLEVLHKEGFMKKVPTSQVIMTPTAQAKIRLDELNNILAEMAKGEEATKKLAEMDATQGLQKRDNTKKNREVGEPAKPVQPSVQPLQAPVDGVLTDEAIASQQLQQATRMRSEANSMLAEAARLEADAAKLTGSPAVVVKKGPGRPKKNDNNTSTKKATQA